MAKKADIISFKEAYNKVSKQKTTEVKKKSKKDNKKVNDKVTKDSVSNKSMPKPPLTKDEYIKKVMNETTRKTQTSKDRVNKEIVKSDIKISTKENNKRNKTSKKINETGNSSKKVKKKKKPIIFIIVLILIIVIVGVGIYYLCTSPQFNLTTVNIKPSKTYTIEEIWEKSGISYGNNIFLYNTRKLSENIQALPYVKTAKVSIKLPSTLVIEVTERTREYVCLNSDTNQYLYLSVDGYILEEVSRDKLKSEDVIITGIEFDEKLTFGTKLNDVELSKLVALYSIKEEFTKEQVTRKITSASFENGYTNITVDDKVKIIFPNTEKLTYNVRFLKKIFEEIDDVPGVIDMTKPSPSFIYTNI